MREKFMPPDFSKGSIEIRVENGEVHIYGTAEGLRWLSETCLDMARKNKLHHVHIDDYQLTTERSIPCVVALFPSGDGA